MDYIKTIVEDIKNGQCVLVIGPDIIDFGENSFFETLSKELAANASYTNTIDTAPQFVFENEELFQLLPTARETTLVRIIKDFYQRQNAYDAPLTRISQIPFNTIISLMPDDRLTRLFASQELDFSYSYYPKEGNYTQVAIPSKAKPLVYNLLGDFNDNNAVLTFDHLFTFLSSVLPEKGLPDNLQVVLKRAMTILFLGVRFDKWHVQLLLRKISSKESKKDRYTIVRGRQNSDVSAFIARRLELDFLPKEPLQFLDELYAECKTQDMLKRKPAVFISYAGKNIDVAQKAEAILKQNDIVVIRDELSSRGGQQIQEFIDSIENVDAVLLLVSGDSLKSTWVNKEINVCLKHRKKFYPHYLDKSFLDPGFWDGLNMLSIEQIAQIGKKITERGAAAIHDLLAEREDWTNFQNDLPSMRKELTRDIIKSLMPEDFDKNIQQLINELLNRKGGE